jgi:hypothetical protein
MLRKMSELRSGSLSCNLDLPVGIANQAGAGEVAATHRNLRMEEV